jgi:periplasmic divalent cation tolerance protein
MHDPSDERAPLSAWAEKPDNQGMYSVTPSSDPAGEALMVFISCPDTHAEALAQQLVENRLAACVNLVAGARSVYRWRGAVETAAETLLIAKTDATHFEALRSAVLAAHPYELPEIVAVSISQGHAAYLDWIRDSLNP